MKATFKQVTDEALGLSLAERSALTRILIETLDGDPAGEDPGLEQAWQREVEKRVDEALSGRAKTVPAGEVFARLRARHG